MDILSATLSANIDKVREFLDQGGNVNARNRDESTPLHYAIITGYEPVIRLLLDRGADVNAKNMYGDTALHFASIRKGYEHIVRLLLEKGADIYAKTREGKTPLQMAIMEGNGPIVRILKDREASNNPRPLEDDRPGANAAAGPVRAAIPSMEPVVSGPSIQPREEDKKPPKPDEDPSGGRRKRKTRRIKRRAERGRTFRRTSKGRNKNGY